MMETLIKKLQRKVTKMAEGESVNVRLPKRFNSVEVSNKFSRLEIPNCGCISLTTCNAVLVFKLCEEEDSLQF